ncbi:MAG: virulence protein [Oscillospiraceae bacterium]|nr:virulence protein [Oscillospiraceae bacterium]
MKVDYNVTGKDRKSLVNVIATLTGKKAEYLGMPTASYKVGCFTVDRNGTLEFDDRADSKGTEDLIKELDKRGFTAKVGETSGEESETADGAEQGENMGLTISVPLAAVSTGNLTNLLKAKGALIKKALGIDDMPVEIGENKVSFPWFPEMPGSDASKAYAHFIAALCKLSKDQKRVSSTEHPADNEKYAFRCFLLRLGFIGPEYKQERKILLKNLTGNSSFRNGAKKEATDDEISE